MRLGRLGDHGRRTLQAGLARRRFRVIWSNGPIPYRSPRPGGTFLAGASNARRLQGVSSGRRGVARALNTRTRGDRATRCSAAALAVVPPSRIGFTSWGIADWRSPEESPAGAPRNSSATGSVKCVKDSAASRSAAISHVDGEAKLADQAYLSGKPIVGKGPGQFRSAFALRQRASARQKSNSRSFNALLARGRAPLSRSLH